MVNKLTSLLFLLLLLLQLSVILCKANDGIAITLHRSEESLHAELPEQEDVRGSNLDKEYERLARMVESTRDRARVLKRGVHRAHGNMSKGKESAAESLYARSFGGYSIKFSVGTPAQDLLLIMDTGSDLVWVPCTRNYTCINCPADSASNGVFLPRMSSSFHLVTCADPICEALYGNDTELLCNNCTGSLKNCSDTCPSYEIHYGKGSTAGLLLTETLNLPLETGGGSTRAITPFAVGCSIVASQQPSGIAGFGRGALSMPSQLREYIGRDRFAYCLQNHRFDEENKRSLLVLVDKALPNGIPLNYTSFLINSRAPPTSQYGVYYYIGLREVSIGGKRLKLPSKLLRFDTKGNGGTIIDSGTTFTIFSDEIFQQIAGEFASQIGYRRAGDAEAETGLGLCFNVSGVENIELPEFAFHFKGGSDMVLPVANYFIYSSNFSSICLTMLSSGGILEADTGPAVILGNYQQEDFYFLYEREKNRLGFTQQTCKTFA